MLTVGRDIRPELKGHTLQFGHADRAREDLMMHINQINTTMMETALKPQIPIEPSIYKYFLKGERIAKERIY